MDLSIDQPLTCLFRRELDNVYQQVQTPFLDVTQVFQLSECLVDTLKDPSRCDDGCYQSLDYAQVLLECVARLLDFSDMAWSTTCRELASNSSKIMQPPASAVVSRHAVATIGKFVLDDSEKDLLLQEMLRGMIISMNEVVSSIHHRISQRSRAMGQGHLETASSSLLERTYSALARYKSPAIA